MLAQKLNSSTFVSRRPCFSPRLKAKRAPRVLRRAEEDNTSTKIGETQAAPQQPQGSTSSGPGVAVAAVAAAVLAFGGARLLSPGPTLATLEQSSVPLEVALSNNKPTVVEFYANWCEMCRELVPDALEVESKFGDKVNFVMLNIENSKWSQEIVDFKVKGIPEFVFLDKEGTPLAATVGRLPRSVLEGNVAALARNEVNLPFSGSRGQTSSMIRPEGSDAPRLADPRDHA